VSLERLTLAIVMVCSTGAGSVLAQTAPANSSAAYPTKPIRILTAAAGGGVDFAARQIALGLAGPLGQPVVVENRGGSGIIPAEIVAKAPADGYTLLVAASAMWLAPFLQDAVPFDPVSDFAPITLAVTAPNVLVVTRSLPVNSVRELIQLSKARPNQLNYATTGTGSSTHLAAELFNAMAGVAIVRVNYKATVQAMADLMSGQVQVMFANASSALPQVHAGRLKALAVSTAEPSALTPGLPTLAASGVPGYESASINAMFAPAKTPNAIISRLYQETARVLNTPEVKERFIASGVEAIASTPEELSAKVRLEMARMGKVIKQAGIRAE
jgi:tripartite-type tricarboxylate transporter receptor subunit TctC